jgi:hypothetical protein
MYLIFSVHFSPQSTRAKGGYVKISAIFTNIKTRKLKEDRISQTPLRKLF